MARKSQIPPSPLNIHERQERIEKTHQSSIIQPFLPSSVFVAPATLVFPSGWTDVRTEPHHRIDNAWTAQHPA